MQQINFHFLDHPSGNVTDFDNTAVISTDYGQADPTQFLLKAREMKSGNPRFFEPPHLFNGEALDNMNNTGSVGWSYSFGLPTVAVYRNRLNYALTTNQSSWLGYNCPGTSQSSGFPYTSDLSPYYNSYNASNCNVGFSCFAFVYEAARQAGINVTPITSAGQFITNYGTVAINQRKVGDLVLYNFNRSGGTNQQSGDFDEHVAIISELSNVTTPKLDKVISSFGAHQFFNYGVYECKLWDFHSTSNSTPGIFDPPPYGYWGTGFDQWDETNIRIVRILN